MLGQMGTGEVRALKSDEKRERNLLRREQCESRGSECVMHSHA